MNPVSEHQSVFVSFLENAKKKSVNLEQSQPLQKKTGVIDKFSCDKCRFSSRDMAQFHKHALQHDEMTFSCSYCNHVSYTRGESQRHLVKHTGTFPFKCKFCPYGAVRNDYIMKHTQRVHKISGEKVTYSAAKKILDLERQPHSVLNVPTPTMHLYTSSLSKDTGVRPAGVVSKTQVNNGAMKKRCQASSLSKVQVELLSPLNEPIQHDEPLTIAYPPEMTIPPGCFVELVEVKTVNGTKELELQLVSQQAADTESPVKDSGVETGRVDVQSSQLVKPTFRCSVIPQENKAVHPGPCTLKRPVGKRDFASAKTTLDVPCDRGPELKKPPTQPQVTVKEETEGELSGLTRHEAVATVGRQAGRELQSSGKPQFRQGSSKPQSVSSGEGSVIYAIPKKVARLTEVSKAHNVGEPPHHTVPKEEIRLNIPASRLFPPCESGTRSKGKGFPVVFKPFVKPITEKRTEAKRPHAQAPAPAEFPVISSVFSISHGPGNLPGCIQWEQTLDGNLAKESDNRSLPLLVSLECSAQNVGVSAVPEQGNSKDVLSTRRESMPVGTCVDLRGMGRKLTTKREKGRNAENAKADLSNLSIEAPGSSLLGQRTMPNLNKSSPSDTERVKNPVRAPTNQKSQKHLEESLPVFIPQGAVLKISDSNKPSLTLKISTQGSEGGGSWMPRPVLFSGVKEQIIADTSLSCQNKVPKLSLKRRRSGAENSLAEDWQQQDSLTDGEQVDTWKLSKHKKRKKHKKASKVKVLSQTTGKKLTDTCRLWLVPLKEDQLVTSPGPNQPVVVLNHPKPQAMRERTNMQRLCGEQPPKLPTEPDQTRHTLKMKLKKVHQNKYQVVGFVYGGFPTKALVKC
ncbi:hypothetical protein AAFF_G00435040 [Aldrovandia affinis]|uniref:C2H2-type domain-containing protein n=1 Tax=Aldrovandia affinis TaxID=143900 RepID=A0AAD7WIF1_9TELE|nr:hypothetical protein AAFF_G00435040 [Aldrovandia affinis]